MTAKPTARKRPAPPTPIITQRLSLLAEATARLAKAKRLVKRWRKEQRDAQHNIRIRTAISCANRSTLCERIRTLRRCADQLERILKT